MFSEFPISPPDSRRGVGNDNNTQLKLYFMFNQLKDLYQLQAKAKEVQQKLASENVVVEENGITLTMNGSQEIVAIVLPENLNKKNLEKNLPAIFNSAIKKVQQLMAKMMMG